MQTVSDAFTTRSQGQIRKLDWRVLMSFDKELDEGIEFFTIGVSTIGGTDIIKGEGNVLQEWDKYAYTDYSDRVVSLEWTRQEDPITSVSMAMVDIVFDNHDDFFTPGLGSDIDGNIKPYRPIKLFSGFGTESIPQFVGLTEKMPVLNTDNKTATFHAIDYLYAIINRNLSQDLVLTEVSTGDAMAAVLEDTGLQPTHYSLDYTFNTIPFFYYPKDTNIGSILRDLVTSEIGRLYMDEIGTITFKNRQNYIDESVFTFTAANIVGITSRSQDDVVNSVHIRSDVRREQELTDFWELADQYFEDQVVLPGDTLDITANFNDPVTSVDEPLYIDDSLTSYFTVNTLPDGSGAANSTDVTLTSFQALGKSYAMTFTNSGPDPLFITDIHLFATPAPVVRQIDITVNDQDSIDLNELHKVEIVNNLIQTNALATSIGQIITMDYADVAGIEDMETKGTPAFQLGDPITVDLGGVETLYRIGKIVNRIMDGKFTQILTIKKRRVTSYFTIGMSVIGGSDLIAP